MIAITIIFTVLSAILYRLGGLGREQDQWIPAWLKNTKYRDVGCSLLAVGWMAIYYERVEWFWYLASFGVLWGALTTYWDFVFEKDNFWVHGLGIGVAFIFYAIATGDWIGWGIRCLSLAVLTGGWCAIFKNDWVEELGRGAFIIATLPLMMIGG